MAGISDVVNVLQGIGFFDYVLPFLLVFVIIYSILRLTKVLGDPKDASSANAIVSLVVALFIFYFGNIYQLGPFFGFLLSRGAIYLIIFVLGAVVSNFLNVAFVEKLLDKAKDEQKLIAKAFTFFVTIAVIWAMLGSTPFVGPIVFGSKEAGVGSDILVSVFVLALLGGLVYMITAGG